MKIILTAFCLLILTAAAPATSRFPKSFQGAWARNLQSCEPEFTNGFIIGQSMISYYEGQDELIALTPIAIKKTRLGIASSLTANMRYTHAGEISLSTKRLTLIKDVLYQSDAKIPLEKHLSFVNKMVHCPEGSTAS